MKHTLPRWVPTAALAALVAACGGSGGGGESSNAAPTGIARTVHVTGAISGFGSVVVNGVHYESDSASVTLEGQPGTVGQLKVGEVVHIDATVDSQGKAHATSIDQERLIQGPVQAVDLAGGKLTIAGQVIRVDNGTSFDRSIPGGSLAGIAIGDWIEVHGHASATGEALATRVEKADSGENEIEITGPVTAIDSAAHRLTVGRIAGGAVGQVVDYSTATLEGFPATGPAVGDIVEVEGTAFLADGALKAVELENEDSLFDDDDHGDEGEVEGLVTRFVSATDFDVARQPVTTTSATKFVDGTAADLALDVKVEVEGTIDSSGVLVASKVDFEHESTVKLSGPVEAVDATAGTIAALGVTFRVTPTTRIEDQEGDDQYLNLSDLRVGDWVELCGYPDHAGSSNMIATRLERDDPEDEVELSGPADNFVAPNFEIVGVDIATTPSTEFEDDDTRISSADFFTRAPGHTVDVEGSWDGTTLTAAEVEIEQED